MLLEGEGLHLVMEILEESLQKKWLICCYDNSIFSCNGCFHHPTSNILVLDGQRLTTCAIKHMVVMRPHMNASPRHPEIVE